MNGNRLRLAALYDIHGNLPALEAVLRELRAARIEHVVVGGDVLPGPMPVECLDALSSLDVQTTFIRGNGEVAVLAERDGRDSGVPPQYRPGIQWVAGELTAAQARALAAWPSTARVGETLFCHATPRNETDIFVHTTPEEALRPIFATAGAATVVCGHTHMPFDRRVGDVRVVNAGSVGMPFGPPGACWLLLDDDGLHLRRTEYDVQAAAERIRATRYPGAAGFAAQYVIQRPAEAQMLELYRRADIAHGTAN